jgi:hypothetical protein
VLAEIVTPSAETIGITQSGHFGTSSGSTVSAEHSHGAARRRRRGGSDRARSEYTRLMTYVSPPLKLDIPDGARIGRADIHFEGVEQAGPSFEARVFLNNPDADQQTPADPGRGYAGAFHVYGYGDAHMQPGGGSEPLSAPMHRYLTATEAIKLARQRSDTVRVTVVPMLPAAALDRAGDPLKITRVYVTVDE